MQRSFSSVESKRDCGLVVRTYANIQDGWWPGTMVVIVGLVQKLGTEC